MLIAIVAMDPNKVIGLNGALPRHIPEDLKQFKTKTLGHTVVMGRTTYESLPANFRPLQGRTTIVLSTTMDPNQYHNIQIMKNKDEFLTRYEAHRQEQVFIIGGSQIFGTLLDECDQLIISHIHQEYQGDTYFPDFEEKFIVGESQQYENFTLTYYYKK